MLYATCHYATLRNITQNYATLRSNPQVVYAVDDKTSKQMLKYIGGCPKESIVDIEGTLVKADNPVESCSQRNLEIQGNYTLIIH